MSKPIRTGLVNEGQGLTAQRLPSPKVSSISAAVSPPDNNANVIDTCIADGFDNPYQDWFIR